MKKVIMFLLLFVSFNCLSQIVSNLQIDKTSSGKIKESRKRCVIYIDLKNNYVKIKYDEFNDPIIYRITLVDMKEDEKVLKGFYKVGNPGEANYGDFAALMLFSFNDTQKYKDIEYNISAKFIGYMDEKDNEGFYTNFLIKN